MKLAGLIFIFAMAAPVLAFADAYPEEWTACTKDSECVKAYACEDIALNKNYLKDFQDAFDEGCDGSTPANPKALAKCVDKECNIVMPEEKEKK